MTPLTLPDILFPLSPTLPLIVPLFTSSLKALGTAEYLHKPYFAQKRMTHEAEWIWVDERKWAYRAFGFSAALLESLPIIGLVFSISNRIGAAMWSVQLSHPPRRKLTHAQGSRPREAPASLRPRHPPPPAPLACGHLRHRHPTGHDVRGAPCRLGDREALVQHASVCSD